MQPKKRILVIAGGTYISGAEKVTLDVVQGFKENGHEVHCMVSGWNNGDFIDQLKSLHINHTAIKLGWYYTSKFLWSLDSLVNYPKAIFSFIKLQKKFKPDVVYTISFRQIVLLYTFFTNNIIYHIHDQNSNSRQSKFFLKLIDKKVKKYITVSKFIQQDLINCNIAFKKISVIYNGIEILPLPEKTNQPKDIFSIGIIGQVIHRKGHLVAIDALKKLVDKHLKVQLVIVGVGDTAFEQEVKQKIKQDGLENYVIWKGFIKNIEIIYQGLDVVLAPTQNEEPFGLMACEANMLGIPVIVANKGGLMEIVEDGLNGYRIDATNATQIAEAIEKLYHNPLIREQMGINGRNKTNTLFSKKAMNSSIQQIILQS